MGLRTARVGHFVLAGTLSLLLSGCLGSGSPLSGSTVDPAGGESTRPGRFTELGGSQGGAGEEARAASLVGRVHYRWGAGKEPLPLQDARVVLDGRAIPYANGSFQVDRIAPGPHTLEVRATHFRPKRFAIELEPGETRRITVAMKPVYSASDLDDLARLVRAEAGGEPYVGQVAVAASALNRVLSSRYPDTIPGVVYQAWSDPDTGRRYVQYSPVINGTIWQPATPASRAAVADALAGWDPSYGATGFFNGTKTDNQWVRRQAVTTVIGNHAFFR